MKRVKRIASFIMCLTVVGCLFVTPISVSAEGANNRVKTFIKMAAGAEVTNEDVSNLTVDQLQFLGVYLSNFYQPFGTEFGGANDKIAENCKSDMKSALQTKLAFSDEMSEALIEYVLQMTRESTQYLDLYMKTDEGEFAKLSNVYCNYYNFFRLMLGKSSDVFSGYLYNMGKSNPWTNLDCNLLSSVAGIIQGDSVNNNSIKANYYYTGNNKNDFVNNESNTSSILWRTLDELSSLPYGTATWSANKSSIGYLPQDKKEDFGLSVVDTYNIPEEFMKTLYLYLGLGGEAELYNPGSSKSFDNVTKYQGSVAISYCVDKNTEGSNLYWCASKIGSHGVSAYKIDNQTTKLKKVVGKSVLQLKNIDLWNESEKLMHVIDSKNTLYLGYEKDGEVKVVYDCTTTEGLENGMNYTPSQQEFMKCLETVDMDKGYGNNLMDFNMADGAEDSEWDSSTLQSVCEKLSNYDSLHANKDLVLKSTIWGQRMAVDCFGNILCMGANHQYIAVPACMNPYTWQAVDENGNDIGNPGAFMNIVNAKNLVQVDNGIISSIRGSGKYISDSFGSSVDFSSKTRMHSVATLNNYVSTNSGYAGIGKVLSSDEVIHKKNEDLPARIIRGQGDFTVNDNCWWPWGGTDIAKTSIQNIVELFSEMYPYDRSVNGASDVNDMWGFWSDEYVPIINNVRDIATEDGGGWLSNNSSVNLLDGYIFIDNLGVYKNEDGSDHDYSAFNVEHYLDDNGTPAGSIANGIKTSNDFGSNTDMLLSGKLNSLESASSQALSSIYVSYVYASFYTDDNKADTIGKLGYRFAKENLPNPPTSLMDIDIGTVMVDMELNAIRDWTYYLLHPTKGFEYVTTLITNKVNHLLLGWHSDMVGTNGVGITAGTTKYRSNVGYVTMPDLSEIEWTDKLISFYQDCIPFLIILIVVLMLFAFITGILSLQRAVLASLLFSMFLLLPTTLINGCVRQSNAISQRIYGEKFTYWAMVQQESYASQIDEAANSVGSSGKSTYENYLRTLYGLNQQVYTNQGNESILLKWQAPKKMASLVLSSEDQKSLSGLSDIGNSMLHGMLGQTFSGQSYVDDENAIYMYRSYLDISNFSRYIYQGIATGKVSSTKDYSAIGSILSGSFSDDLTSSVRNMGNAYVQYRNDGYSSWGSGESSASPNFDYVTVPLSSQIMADAVRKSAGLSSFDTKDDLIYINQDIFNFGIPMFTNDSEGTEFSIGNFASTGGIPEGSVRYNDLNNFMTPYRSNEDAFVGLAAYSLYSENPFYYYSWKLYHDGLGYTSSLYDVDGYKDLLLGQPDGGYFYMNEGNGGLKDFMDMRSLFTYIIPYMKECNDLVREWDKTYGIFIYDGVPTEEGHWADVSGDQELTAKYWHNLNVSRLYCLYCPWVDIMYDCSYAKPETIAVMGRRVVIKDPINPASYPEDRPMIFSEAEMKDYGLSEADLTSVERKILKCNEDMQERMYELLNYFNFSDITLNTAAAMQCAFSFNTTFSETGIMTENHNIYPQSYDLANFSYDAFLRFILAESTGEDLLNSSKLIGTHAGETTGDFYERVVNNSSTTTAIVMLILDVLSIYVLPAFKMFFLVAIFISSVLIVFVSLCKIEDNAKFLKKVISGFLSPLVSFFAITVGFSIVISWFMGTGNNSVTQTNRLSISLGDPVVVILVMIALDILLLILYWKILKGVLKVIKKEGKLALGFVSGVIGAVGGLAVGSVVQASNSARESVYSAEHSGGYRNGTGVESPRAISRGSHSVEDRQDRKPFGKGSRRSSMKSYEYSKSDSDSKRRNLNKKAKNGVENIRRGKKSDEGKNSKNT